MLHLKFQKISWILSSYEMGDSIKVWEKPDEKVSWEKAKV